MDPKNLDKQREPEETRFLSFPHLPEGTKREDGTPALNRWSSTLTTGHNFPGAQVCRFYYAQVILKTDIDRTYRLCYTQQVFLIRRP